MDRKSTYPRGLAVNGKAPGQEALRESGKNCTMKIAWGILPNRAGTRSAATHCADAWRLCQPAVPDREGRKPGMTEQELRKKLELLKTEHRDLDAAIAALTEAARGTASADQLQIARLKKRKLRLRDQIAIIEDTLLPDIIA
jgi:hypothetical protein